MIETYPVLQELYCDDCEVKMELQPIAYKIDPMGFAYTYEYKCPKCGKTTIKTESDLAELMELVEKLKEENANLKKALSQKILLVEDGSVDIDKLVEDGFYVIVYRQGSKPPMWRELEKVEGK